MHVLAIDDSLTPDAALPAWVEQVLVRPSSVEGDVSLQFPDDIGEGTEGMRDPVSALLQEMDAAPVTTALVHGAWSRPCREPTLAAWLPRRVARLARPSDSLSSSRVSPRSAARTGAGADDGESAPIGLDGREAVPLDAAAEKAGSVGIRLAVLLTLRKYRAAVRRPDRTLPTIYSFHQRRSGTTGDRDYRGRFPLQQNRETPAVGRPIEVVVEAKDADARQPCPAGSAR